MISSQVYKCITFFVVTLEDNQKMPAEMYGNSFDV